MGAVRQIEYWRDALLWEMERFARCHAARLTSSS